MKILLKFYWFAFGSHVTSSYAVFLSHIQSYFVYIFNKVKLLFIFQSWQTHELWVTVAANKANNLENKLCDWFEHIWSMSVCCRLSRVNLYCELLLYNISWHYNRDGQTFYISGHLKLKQNPECRTNCFEKCDWWYIFKIVFIVIHVCAGRQQLIVDRPI